MGLITLYRVTNLGDNILNVPPTEIINFNGTSFLQRITSAPNAFITSYKKSGQSGIADQQAVGVPTSNLQPTGKYEDVYTLNGYISKLNDSSGQNAFANILVNWDNDEQKVNNNFRKGRFGIQFNDFHGLDIVPQDKNENLQIGLIWQNLEWDVDFLTKPMIGKFILTLKVSRGDLT